MATAQARYRARHPERQRAWNAVHRAIKAGLLVRPAACGRCETACRPQASHDDYSRTLDVEWLCRPCHDEKDADKHVGRASRLELVPEAGKRAAKDRDCCKHGHEYTPENTYLTARQRHCRTCRREEVRRRYYAKKETV